MTVDFSNILQTMNDCYHPYFDDWRGVQVFKGGASAGKSVFLAQRDVYRLLAYPGYNLLCLRKVGATIKDSVLAEIVKAIRDYNLESFFKVNLSPGREEITCINKNKILFRGLDDPEKIKSITFETGPLTAIRIEEASEITEDDYNAVELRLRGSSNIAKTITLSFNPIDKQHWLKHRFFDRKLKDKDGFICETTYKDNKYLTEQDRERIERYKDIDYYYYMVYALNQWGDRTNTSVFHNLQIHDFKFAERHFDTLRHGQDYGFNHANAMLSVGWKDGELYIYREFYYKQKTNKQFIDILKKTNFPKEYRITGDSAHPDKIAEWSNEENGYNVQGAIKGKDSVRKGIDYLKSLPKIHIHETNCPNAVREFLNFKYRQLKDGTITDDYVEINDDTIAAVRYACEDFFLDGQYKPVWVEAS